MTPKPQSDAALQAFLRRLAAARETDCLTLGVRRRCERLAWQTLALLFPQYSPAGRCEEGDVAAELAAIERELESLVRALAPEMDPSGVVSGFVAALPTLRDRLTEDAEALHAGDPAARSVDEVIVAYPGFLAVALHRLAHCLHRQGLPLLPRLLAELAHRETGIDIHPAAIIGRAFAIDHGTGVVIGETAVIGDRVKLYQGVTLGALSVRKALAGTKRHPTIEDDVVIYANATILGGDTVIGAGSVIGGNVWLTRSVPPRSVVTAEQMRERPRREAEELLEFNI